MKTLFFLIASLLLVYTTHAQQDSTSRKKTLSPGVGKYCVVLREGKSEVTDNGIPLKADTKLENGNQLTTSGTLVKKDGTIQMIKPGSCVNSDGNEVEQADGRK